MKPESEGGAKKEFVEYERKNGEAVEKLQMWKRRMEKVEEKILMRAEADADKVLMAFFELSAGGLIGKRMQDAMLKLLKGIKLDERDEKVRCSGEMKMKRDDEKARQNKGEAVMKEGHRSGSESDEDNDDDNDDSDSDKECYNFMGYKIDRVTGIGET